MLLRENSTGDKHVVALFSKSPQESRQVDLAQRLRRSEEAVEVPPLSLHLPDREPVLLHRQKLMFSFDVQFRDVYEEKCIQCNPLAGPIK